MPPVGFEPTISAGERSQTYALNRAATLQTHCVTKLTMSAAFRSFSKQDLEHFKKHFIQIVTWHYVNVTERGLASCTSLLDI